MLGWAVTFLLVALVPRYSASAGSNCRRNREDRVLRCYRRVRDLGRGDADPRPIADNAVTAQAHRLKHIARRKPGDVFQQFLQTEISGAVVAREH